MIHDKFMRVPYRLTKLIRGKKQVCGALDAVDNHYILKEHLSFDEEGKAHLPNFLRGRPYLAFPYESYFCDAWKNDQSDPFDHEDCKECKPFDTYWIGADLGFLTGWINGIVVVDNDTGMSDEFFKLFIRKNVGDFPDTWTAQTGSGGTHYYFSHAGPYASNLGKFMHKVDFLGDNRWCMIPPCESSKGSYQWLRDPDTDLARLPFWALELDKIHVDNKRKTQRLNYNKKRESFNYDQADTHDQIVHALNNNRIENFDGSQWYAIGYALCGNGFSNEFIDWCGTDTRDKMNLSSSQLRHFQSNRAGVGIANFFKIMIDNGWRFQKSTNKIGELN